MTGLSEQKEKKGKITFTGYLNVPDNSCFDL